jgi:hypothetical protein
MPIDWNRRGLRPAARLPDGRGEANDVSDPLRWWPGKLADCKRIAQLVEDVLPGGDVIECGGEGVFADLLPAHQVTVARISNGVDLCDLPWEEGTFDVGVSARVLEILPPRLRAPYLRELLRVCRYRVFVAVPLQPELEAIDKIKNTYLWDTLRVWQYPGPRPDDLEAALEGFGVEVVFHVEAPRGASMAAPGGASGWIESFLSSSTMGGSDLSGMATPPFLVAEIVKSEILPRVLSTSLGVAH